MALEKGKITQFPDAWVRTDERDIPNKHDELYKQVEQLLGAPLIGHDFDIIGTTRVFGFRCICSCSSVESLFVVQDLLTGIQFMVGSTCINQFNNSELNSQLRARKEGRICRGNNAYYRNTIWGKHGMCDQEGCKCHGPKCVHCRKYEIDCECIRCQTCNCVTCRCCSVCKQPQCICPPCEQCGRTDCKCIRCKQCILILSKCTCERCEDTRGLVTTCRCSKCLAHRCNIRCYECWSLVCTCKRCPFTNVRLMECRCDECSSLQVDFRIETSNMRCTFTGTWLFECRCGHCSKNFM